MTYMKLDKHKPGWHHSFQVRNRHSSLERSRSLTLGPMVHERQTGIYFGLLYLCVCMLLMCVHVFMYCVYFLHVYIHVCVLCIFMYVCVFMCMCICVCGEISVYVCVRAHRCAHAC